MRITYENGKKYRAYSPEEFFRAPESPQLHFNLNEPKPKRPNIKKLDDGIHHKAD